MRESGRGQWASVQGTVYRGREVYSVQRTRVQVAAEELETLEGDGEAAQPLYRIGPGGRIFFLPQGQSVHSHHQHLYYMSNWIANMLDSE